ncbi:MAG TPA: DUF885 domain-containing protein [Polyangiaceae bacterium]|nr:DUF885 domain-containing protein [Polyangiaceae bacterium]
MLLVAWAGLITGSCTRAPARAADTGAAAVTNEDAVRLVREVAREYAAAYSSDDRLPDNSLEALSTRHAREDAWLRALADVDVGGLWGTPEWTLAGLVKSTLESSVALRVCRVELWPAHQHGWQTSLLTSLDSQPLGTPAARSEALTRWEALPRYLATEVENLREGLRLAYTVPRRNAELAVVQLDALLANPSSSPLGAPLRRDSDQEFQTRWRALLDGALMPAIKRYRDFLRDDYAPRARTSLGLQGLPNGEACYRAQLLNFTTTSIDPRELYRRGEALVAQREAKGIELARRLYGSEVQDLRAIKAAMDVDPRNRFASADEALAFVTAAMERASLTAPRWFQRVPRSPLVLAPFDDFEATSHPAARYEPADRDGSRPARYRIDVTNFAALTRAYVEHTTFHEGIPGHHLQVGIDIERGELGVPADPTSFIEGWARYAESLADEMGLYSSELERLGATLHLPTGVVVDPGIHALGWTREQAVAWVKQKQVAFSDDEAASYVDRVAIWPGQMVSYGVGELEIASLRREAEARLGAGFDARAFHTELLRHGAITLPMARDAITRWIASRAAVAARSRAPQE